MTESKSRYWCYAVLVVIILFSAYLRIRLRNFPLERDEGEYAYAGQLMLQGIPPYQLAYNMKLPGTYSAYTVMMAAFGQTTAGIHLGVLVVNAATIVLVFLLASRLFGRLAGVTAAACFMLLTNSEEVLGFSGHAEHFVVLAYLAGFLVLLKAIEQQRRIVFFWSGILFGVGFLFKQPGMLFGVFGGSYLLVDAFHSRRKEFLPNVVVYSAGVSTPFLATCLLLLEAGVFSKFWFWTFSYGRAYAGNQTLSSGLSLLRSAAISLGLTFGPIFLVAIAGVVAVVWDKEFRKRATFIAGLLLFSFGSVSIGLYYREHYFILLWPVISMLAGVTVSAWARKFSALTPGLRFLPALILLVGFGFAIYDQREILFQLDAVEACRKVYSGNPFPEAVDAAAYVRTHSSPQSRIAVIGSEPEIYFYAHRQSATGYIYSYALMEPQKYALEMQKEMIGEIESAKPEFVVFVEAKISWLIYHDSDRMILDWSKDYLSQQYDMVKIFPMEPSIAHNPSPKILSGPILWSDRLMVFQRKPAPLGGLSPTTIH